MIRFGYHPTIRNDATAKRSNRHPDSRPGVRTPREKLPTTGKERHNPIVSQVSRRERSNNGGISVEFVRSIVARVKKLCEPL